MSLSYKEFLDSATERMDKTVEHYLHDARGMRTGRANPGLIENLRVDYYGSKTPLSQLASITVPEPRCLLVKPFDASIVKEIEKAVLAADLGLNPSAMGTSLRISVPHLSEDQRKKMVARVKSMAEDAKVSLRNVRRDALKEVDVAHNDKKRDVAVTDDDVQSAKSDIQDVLKAHEKTVDDALVAKSAEILEV